MVFPPQSRVLVFLLLSCNAVAQVLSFPTSGGRFPGGTIDPIDAARQSFDIFRINSRNADTSPLVTPGGSVSKFDLKAPGKAKREYEKGYQLLQRKELQAAIEHLSKAIRIYVEFVAAHNALGTAYLDLNQPQLARDEFAKASAIDDHLPISILDLGIAQLALKDYPHAEQSLKKASSMVPLDVQVSLALEYAEFEKQDYPAVVTIAHDVHSRKHKGAELVHYYASAAWDFQNNPVEAQREMETLLQEDPQSASADQFRQILTDLKAEQKRRTEGNGNQVAVTASLAEPRVRIQRNEAEEKQRALQDEKQSLQIAEAEAALGLASSPSAAPSVALAEFTSPRLSSTQETTLGSGFVLRSSADEVDVFFAATYRGKSVTDLTPADIRVLDNNHVPEKIIGFRNESQLALRLGLVIDTSASVRDRLPFEQKAAIRFLQDVLTDSRDLAFVVGVNNSVLMKQDFTPDRTLLSHAVDQLAPGGGTALWDAVTFAAEKLGQRAETQPVARVLVVISDGEENSSATALKETIQTALRSETVVYTVSTRELMDESPSSLLGDHALKTISELTGGAAFVPGSLHGLSASLAHVQQVIRGRYLLTYKPADFQPDGRYRSIIVAAEHDGHSLKVFARKGYYASSKHADPNEGQ